MSKHFISLGLFSIYETDIIKAILKEAGILSYLLGEEGVNWGVGIGATSGVDIQVPKDDLERAKQLLEEAKNSE